MRRKSKFLAFLFSLLPGAGQMYLGFMKQGVTIMFAFFFTIFLTDFFRVSFIIAILPVLWCYSFFDTMNKASLPPEELNSLQDKSIFEGIIPEGCKIFSGKHIWIGVILIFLGGFILIDNVLLNELGRLNLINSYIIRGYLRTCVMAGVIIGAGIKLIIGKKEDTQ